MATRDVVLVVFPGLQGLDLIGPAEVFAAANQEVGRPAYRLRLAATAPGPRRTTSGVTVSPTRPSPTCAGPVDTLMVVGGEGTYGAVADEHLVSHVAAWPPTPAASRASARAPSCSPRPACSTAAGPPRTGASATCSPGASPPCDVDPDPIYVRDGNVCTSAGVTAGMDLALALVEDDLGRDVALAIARRLVLFLRRPGNQSQFSAPLQAQAAERDGIRAAQHLVAEHPEARLQRGRPRPGRADERAELRRAASPPRSASRRPATSSASASRPPAACSRTPTTAWRPIAAAAGFGTAETMRRTFLRLAPHQPHRVPPALPRRLTTRTPAHHGHRHPALRPPHRPRRRRPLRGAVPAPRRQPHLRGHRGRARSAPTPALALVADATLADLPHPTSSSCRAGPGQADAEKDEAILDWLRTAHETTTWTTSVCTGSLVLGRRRACSRASGHHLLARPRRARRHGATPTNERVVIDGKVVTAAGVSSGIDMALTLAARDRRRRPGADAPARHRVRPAAAVRLGSEAKAPAHLVAGVPGELEVHPRGLISPCGRRRPRAS